MPAFLPVGNISILSQITPTGVPLYAVERCWLHPPTATGFVDDKSRPYGLLLYHYNTPAQFQGVVDTPEYRRIKYVVWDTTLSFKVADILPGVMPKSPEDLIIEP